MTRQRTPRSLLRSFVRLLRTIANHFWGQTEVRVFRAFPTTGGATAMPAGYHLQFDAHRQLLTNEGDAGSVSGQARIALPPGLDDVLDPRQRLHLVLTHSGEIAAWGMSAFPIGEWGISETDTKLELPPASAILTTFYVHPDHRGAGLYVVFLQALLKLHAGEGAASAWIWCTTDNVPSARGIVRAGFAAVSLHRQRLRLGLSFRALLPVV